MNNNSILRKKKHMIQCFSLSQPGKSCSFTLFDFSFDRFKKDEEFIHTVVVDNE